MKNDNSRQYTIRQVPAEVDRVLRRKARKEGRSLNEVAVEALKTGAGLMDPGIEFHDLDWIAGTWIEDPKFDEVLRAQDRVDRKLWQ